MPKFEVRGGYIALYSAIDLPHIALYADPYMRQMCSAYAVHALWSVTPVLCMQGLDRSAAGRAPNFVRHFARQPVLPCGIRVICVRV